uniref:Uncharacterized protein n=1 Tax=Photinus pyralis TaxID=7054 RepID=A0A1Y1MTF3_PHOPY
MAIPFNVENDSDCDEAVLQLLLSDLCRTLQQIALFQRSRRTQNLNRAPSSPATTTSRHSGASSETERTLLNSTVDLALSLSQVEALQQQNASVSTRRRHPRRSRSEPSCCKEPKPVVISVAVEVTNKDWIQVSILTRICTPGLVLRY